MSLKKNNTLYAYMLSSPTMLILTLLSIFPLGFVIWYSLTDYYYLSPADPNFVGLANYFEIFANPYFRQSIWNTIRFTAFAVVFEVLIGLFMAVVINSIMKMQKTIRTITLLPTLLPPVTVALMWQIMFSNNYGLFNNILNFFGIASVSWLTNPSTAFYAILVIDIWQYAPFVFLLLYAALQSIPSTQYDAAAIDGANALQKFRYVTIPFISKSIIMVTLLRVIDTFRLFDKVNILTKGGPSNTTATITQYIYQQGVNQLKVGVGSAMSVVMTVLVLALASGYIIQNYRKKKVK